MISQLVIYYRIFCSQNGKKHILFYTQDNMYIAIPTAKEYNIPYRAKRWKRRDAKLKGPVKW